MELKKYCRNSGILFLALITTIIWSYSCLIATQFFSINAVPSHLAHHEQIHSAPDASTGDHVHRHRHSEEEQEHNHKHLNTLPFSEIALSSSVSIEIYQTELRSLVCSTYQINKYESILLKILRPPILA